MKFTNLYQIGALSALILTFGCEKETSIQELRSLSDNKAVVSLEPDLEITLEGSGMPQNTFYFKIGTIINNDTAFTYHVVPYGYIFKADIIEDNDKGVNVPIQLNTTYIIYVTSCGYGGGCGINFANNDYLSIRFTDIDHGKAVLKYDICSGGKFNLITKGDHIDMEIGRQTTNQDPMLKSLNDLGW